MRYVASKNWNATDCRGRNRPSLPSHGMKTRTRRWLRFDCLSAEAVDARRARRWARPLRATMRACVVFGHCSLWIGGGGPTICKLGRSQDTDPTVPAPARL